MVGSKHQPRFLSPVMDFRLNRTEADAPVYNVEGLLYRKLLEVSKAAFAESAAEQFHTSPFQEFWQSSPDAEPERLYSEVYNSDAFIKKHAQIQLQPRPSCNLETVIACIMLWSDSTHLTSFSTLGISLNTHGASQHHFPGIIWRTSQRYFAIHSVVMFAGTNSLFLA